MPFDLPNFQQTAEAIQQAIARITATEASRPRKEVTDAQLAAMVAYLGDNGYIPSACLIEPLKAILGGRGVILSGQAGIGKTYLFTILARHNSFARLRVQHVDEILSWLDDCGPHGIADWCEMYQNWHVCIDDLGAERTVSHYGNKDDLLKQVIQYRSEHGARTHITTNLSSEQVRERYGDRILSRIFGMCVPFRLEGNDKRKA